jgi:hypothetical protein
MTRFELYDVANDIGQEHDLSGDLPEVVGELSAEMQRIHQGVIGEGVTWMGLWPE